MTAATKQLIEMPETSAEAPCEAFFFDVETMDPPAETVKRMEAAWLENWQPPESWKDADKIAARKAEALEAWRGKLALTDEAPVAMAGLMFESDTMILHGLKRESAKWLGKNGKRDRVSIEGFSSESELMQAVIDVLDSRIRANTMGVGHNIFRFDLPKLRLAAARNGLVLPEALRVRLFDDEERQRLLDTMQHYTRYFGREGQLMISASEMQRRLGLPVLLDGVADGKDVPGLLARGKIQQVATKLYADLLGVRAAFLRMAGR